MPGREEEEKGRPEGWLRVDLHAHTEASFDCLNRPEAVLERARELGIDRLAITDHNTIQVALALQARDPERIVVGEEVKTREGYDLIGLFLKEEIPCGTPARECCERIRAQGGVVYLPHPLDTRRSGAGVREMERLVELIDVVEVHNSRCLRDSLNERALQWARQREKLQGAGSDSHTLAEMGSGFVRMPPFRMERESFLAALRQGRVEGLCRASPVYRLASLYAQLYKRCRG